MLSQCPGMATIYDVAKRALVSVATVSAVINKSAYVSPELHQRVESAIAGLNYYPNLLARSLVQKRTNTVGMLIPDIANPFYPEVVRGAEDKARETGYTIILGNSDNQRDKEEIYLNLFMSKRVDGILLIKAAEDMSGALAEKLRNSEPAIVLIVREYAPLQADTVLADDVGGAYAAASHLIRMGHRRIGIITGMPDVSTTKGRLAGYSKALEASRISFDPSLVAQGDYGLESGFKAGLLLLRLKARPTAVFATNYLMTVGVLKALEKTKLRCPEDVAIVSYDDFLWSESFNPELTCVAQPKYLMGYRAMELLLSRLRGRHKRKKLVILKNKLRIRESCGSSLRKDQRS